MARWRDIATQALRDLGVVGYSDEAEGEQAALAKARLAQILADLNGPWGGCVLTFGVDDTIPDAYVNGLSWLLAVRLASTFERTPPTSETTALLRIRAVNRPYVRDMDLNEDGTTTEGEIAAVDRSRYY